MTFIICACIGIAVFIFAAFTLPLSAVSSDWEVRLQCLCGWHTKAPSGDESYVQVGCCPECGCRKPRFAGKPGNWELRIMRWKDGAWEAQK